MSANVPMTLVVEDSQEVLAESSKLLAVFRDVSKYVVKGVSIVQFPKQTARTGQTVAVNGSLTRNDVDYGLDSLPVNKVIGDAFGIKNHVEKQNRANALEDGTKETLRSMGVQCDTHIFTALLAATSDSVTGTADIYTDLVNMAKELDINHVPEEDRVLLVDPATYALLRLNDKFIRYDARGTAGIISSGNVGEILNMAVIKSTVVTQTIACHKNAINFAFAGELSMEMESKALDMEKIYAISELFGCAAKQAGSYSVKRTAYIP